MPGSNLARLRSFLEAFARLVERQPGEAELLRHGAELLGALVAVDDWLPSPCAQPGADRYQQYLLHADAQHRFSVVSFVWGPGQSTPVHDHTVWGLIGMLRGAEESQSFSLDCDGTPRPVGKPLTLRPGQVEAVSPSIGDIHQVSNRYSDQTSISIHVYGANIGAVRRHVFTEDGDARPFVSGYANTSLPNIWDLSKEAVTP
ncbi:cysteine dioxygenase (plasmid) [Pseudomonas luteola]|uniref:cysteine dioxygenase n=1 Tax=Pseudomonas luteola TaxID=47886 RepID=UPI003DA04265